MTNASPCRCLFVCLFIYLTSGQYCPCYFSGKNQQRLNEKQLNNKGFIAVRSTLVPKPSHLPGTSLLVGVPPVSFSWIFSVHTQTCPYLLKKKNNKKTPQTQEALQLDLAPVSLLPVSLCSRSRSRWLLLHHLGHALLHRTISPSNLASLKQFLCGH